MLTDPYLTAAAPTGAVAAAAITTATTGAILAATAATATTEPSISAGPSGPPGPTAPAQPCAARRHAAEHQLPPRSQRNPERGDLLALLPGRPIGADICGIHPLLASAVEAAAWDAGATAKGGKDWHRRDQYRCTGTGSWRFVPLIHATFGRAGPAASVLLNEIAEFVASSGSCPRDCCWRMR